MRTWYSGLANSGPPGRLAKRQTSFRLSHHAGSATFWSPPPRGYLPDYHARQLLPHSNTLPRELLMLAFCGVQVNCLRGCFGPSRKRKAQATAQQWLRADGSGVDAGELLT